MIFINSYVISILSIRILLKSLTVLSVFPYVHPVIHPYHTTGSRDQCFHIVSSSSCTPFLYFSSLSFELPSVPSTSAPRVPMYCSPLTRSRPRLGFSSIYWSLDVLQWSHPRVCRLWKGPNNNCIVRFFRVLESQSDELFIPTHKVEELVKFNIN